MGTNILSRLTALGQFISPEDLAFSFLPPPELGCSHYMNPGSRLSLIKSPCSICSLSFPLISAPRVFLTADVGCMHSSVISRQPFSNAGFLIRHSVLPALPSLTECLWSEAADSGGVPPLPSFFVVSIQDSRTEFCSFSDALIFFFLSLCLDPNFLQDFFFLSWEICLYFWHLSFLTLPTFFPFQRQGKGIHLIFFCSNVYLICQ